MATSVFYTGNGASREFAIPFPYRSPTELAVTVDEVAANFTLAAPALVRLTVTPPSGATIRVYRDTAIVTQDVQFQDGAVLTDMDLNAANLQLFQKMQELNDNVPRLLQRSLQVPDGELAVSLPNAAVRAGRILGFDAQGRPTTFTASNDQTALQAQALEFKATAGQTLFQFPVEVVAGYVSVFKNGLRLAAADYTLSGKNITLKTAAAANDVILIQGFSAAIVMDPATLKFEERSVKSKLEDSISVKDTGAKSDGVTDDTVAVQKAVTKALSANPPRAIRVPGPTLITGSIFVDRPTDTTDSYFDIIGEGSRAGFITASTLPMFDTTLTAELDGTGEGTPPAEYLRFTDMHFSAREGIVGTVLSGKMLRVFFQNGFFYKINLMDSPYYAQEIKGSGCTILRCPYPFLRSKGAYAVQWSHSKFQFGGTGFVFDLGDDNATRGNVGLSFVQNEIEGNGGGFLRTYLAGGVGLIANYVEYNAGQFLKVNGGGSYGIAMIGNYISSSNPNKANPAFYEVDWGLEGSGHVSLGNFADGRLHDDSLLLNDTLLVHDGALLSLRKGTQQFSRATASGVIAAQKGVVARAGGGQASATQITAPHVYVSDVATAEDSIRLPKAAPPTDGALTVRVFNLAANAVAVWPMTGDSILFQSPRALVASGETATFTSFNAGAWLRSA